MRVYFYIILGDLGKTKIERILHNGRKAKTEKHTAYFYLAMTLASVMILRMPSLTKWFEYPGARIKKMLYLILHNLYNFFPYLYICWLSFLYKQNMRLVMNCKPRTFLCRLFFPCSFSINIIYGKWIIFKFK